MRLPDDTAPDISPQQSRSTGASVFGGYHPVVGQRLLEQVCGRAGLGGLRSARYLPIGVLNRNWYVATSAAGEVAVKQLSDIDEAQARRQHHLLELLAADGLPVLLPFRSSEGDTVHTVDGQSFVVFPWVQGAHLTGDSLTHAQCADLGVLIGRIQQSLAQHLPTAGAMESRLEDEQETAAHVEKLLAVIEGRGPLDEFDRAAQAHLLWRQRLLASAAEMCPTSDDPGPFGWTHGDFHFNNVLWANGGVAAVVDWDRYRVQGLASEPIRAGLLNFARDDGALDLSRIRAMLAGYQSKVDLPRELVADAVHRTWWSWINNVWPLNWHYERGDTSCDRFFGPNERVMRWWTVHREETIAAFAG